MGRKTIRDKMVFCYFPIQIHMQNVMKTFKSEEVQPFFPSCPDLDLFSVTWIRIRFFSRQRNRDTERQRDRETERQRDRETERQRNRETEREKETEREGWKKKGSS